MFAQKKLQNNFMICPLKIPNCKEFTKSLLENNYEIARIMNCEAPFRGFTKGPFKYYVIMFFNFLDPPTHLFDDLQYCKSSEIAIL